MGGKLQVQPYRTAGREISRPVWTPAAKRTGQGGTCSKGPNEETVGSRANRAKRCLQQMEEEKDKQNRRYLPFPALAGLRNDFSQATENKQTGTWSALNRC